MTYDDYASLDAVNWTLLKEMTVSPARYLSAVMHARPDTTALRLGRLGHVAMFEPDDLLRRYCVWNGGDKSTRKWREFKAAAQCEIVDAEDYDVALEMRDAASAHPAASRYVTAPGPTEHTITWTDEATGLRCKGRLDKIACGAIVDLKTCRDISERAIRRAMMPVRLGGLGYAGQLAWYRRGLVASGYEGAHDDMPCVLICVEKSRPHDCAVYQIAPNALHQGEMDADAALARLVECRALGKWPGAHEEEAELDFDPWFYDGAEAHATRDPVWIEEAV